MENEQEFTHDDFDFTAEIAAGVAWLDDQRPGWRGEVNAERLDMRMPNDCVLGQLYSNYWQAVGVRSAYSPNIVMRHEEAAERGFTITGKHSDPKTMWEKLTMQWKEVLIHNAK